MLSKLQPNYKLPIELKWFNIAEQFLLLEMNRGMNPCLVLAEECHRVMKSSITSVTIPRKFETTMPGNNILYLYLMVIASA